LQPASLMRRIRRSITARSSIRNGATGFRRPVVRLCWAASRRIAPGRSGLPLRGPECVKDLPPLRLILRGDVSRVAAPDGLNAIPTPRTAPGERREGAMIDLPLPKL
jgi:hypothetical protein